ncbi:hypothetical protein CCACVL1_15603 [Corchorus capsularis]|uniref:Uncharacterized protein n=1 Tax=Corchorus capsularis TaxID=210143 RepID=A0A1R3I1V7_COCAP|nr:hypothetical protein CCACVL1_15603 [Corchorus capsularis]
MAKRIDHQVVDTKILIFSYDDIFK